MSMERRYVPGTLYKVKPLCNAPYTGYKNKMQPQKNCIEDCNITNIEKSY